MATGADGAQPGDVAALAVARALLPAGFAVVRASRDGPGRPQPADGGACWSGAGDGPGVVDIDFIPDRDRAELALRLHLTDAADLQRLCDGGILGLWLDGRPTAPASPAPQAEGPPAAAPAVAAGDSLAVDLAITLPLVPGALTSLRLSLDPGEAAGAVRLTAASGAAPAAGEVGPDGRARRRAAVAAAIGAAVVAASGGTAEAAPGNGNGNGNNGNGGNGNNGNGNGNGNGNQQGAVANPDFVTVARQSSVTVDLRANDTSANTNALWITQINGVAVSAGQTVTLPTGQTVRLNANGTVTITADSDIETVQFVYRVATGNGNGVGSTGRVTVTTVPCFTAGTRILTPSGERRVEDLRPGDLVTTLDHGPQALRWVGARTVPATGDLAPIAIRAGTFGPHRALRLSPQHRLLVRDVLADLMFGEAEVLVAARDLVDGTSVTRREGGMVTYLHLLFDRHEIVLAEGLASESYLPGGQTAAGLDPVQVDEVRRLFPDFDPGTGRGYGRAARRLLKRHEAEVLFCPRAAA